MEYKVGETILLKDGRKLMVEEAVNRCLGCFLEGHDCSADPVLYECRGSLREDHKDVIFKEMMDDGRLRGYEYRLNIGKSSKSITIQQSALERLRDHYRKQHQKMFFRCQESRDNKGKADLLDDILKLF